ncbi:MAG: hypothetical protein ACTS5I_17395, partial [Rhodanobacter sp.]
ADTATALETARDFDIDGEVTGTADSFDGTGNVMISTVIASGVIDNDNVHASAGIVDTKLATISTAGKVANSATTGTAAATASTLVLRDGNADAAFRHITLNGVAYVWPANNGDAGQVLQTDGSGNLTWAAASSGFVTGSGTTGNIAKFTGSAALGNSILSEASTQINVGGTLRVANNSAVFGRNNAGSGDVQIAKVTTTDTVEIGPASGGTVTFEQVGDVRFPATVFFNGVGYDFPAADGTSGQVLTTDGSNTLTWEDAAGGGIGGSGTVGTIPVFVTNSTTLGDSILTYSSTVLTVANTVNAVTQYNVNGTKVVGARDTGWAVMAGTGVKDASGGDIATITGAADFNDAQATIELMAQQLKAVVTALMTHGLLGT